MIPSIASGVPIGCRSHFPVKNQTFGVNPEAQGFCKLQTASSGLQIAFFAASSGRLHWFMPTTSLL